MSRRIGALFRKLLAINEACQVWIEQRIKEELETKYENGKSLRAIGRELAAEIERIFEAKLKPTTIAITAGRMLSATNVAPAENVDASTADAGCSGCKMGTAEVIDMMNGPPKESEGEPKPPLQLSSAPFWL